MWVRSSLGVRFALKDDIQGGLAELVPNLVDGLLFVQLVLLAGDIEIAHSLRVNFLRWLHVLQVKVSRKDRQLLS